MDLFSSYQLGRMDLQNRVVMAPMTRSRAIGGVPNELMREYYVQRASAGLIVSEGIAPAPEGLGYARIPGLFSREQVQGWRTITDAVHENGGRIVAQLMHTGRIGHRLNLPSGARVLAPSAVRAEGMMWTDQEGAVPLPEPLEMSADEVRDARDSFVTASRNAIDAGFDGVEFHGANGYLIEQFLNPHSNRRTDAYGGSVTSRVRFVVEAATAAAEAIGHDRLAVRVSPYNTYNDLPLHDAVYETYATLARSLRGLLYLHVVGNPHDGFANTLSAIREGFGGPLILNGGYDRARGNAAIAEGRADLISFARPFISNPDLVARMRRDANLAEPQPQTFYTAGREGYVDYTTL